MTFNHLVNIGRFVLVELDLAGDRHGWRTLARTPEFEDRLPEHVLTIVGSPCVVGSAIDLGSKKSIVGLRRAASRTLAFVMRALEIDRLDLWVAETAVTSGDASELMNVWQRAVETDNVARITWTAAVSLDGLVRTHTGTSLPSAEGSVRLRLHDNERRLAVRSHDSSLRRSACLVVAAHLWRQPGRSGAITVVDGLSSIDGDSIHVAGLVANHRAVGPSWRVADLDAPDDIVLARLMSFRDSLPIGGGGGEGDVQVTAFPETEATMPTLAELRRPELEQEIARHLGAAPDLAALAAELFTEPATLVGAADGPDRLLLAQAVVLKHAPSLAVDRTQVFRDWLRGVSAASPVLQCLVVDVAQPVYDRLRREQDGTEARDALDDFLDTITDQRWCEDIVRATAASRRDLDLVLAYVDGIGEIESMTPALDAKLALLPVVFRLAAGRPTLDIVDRAVRSDLWHERGLGAASPGLRDMIAIASADSTGDRHELPDERIFKSFG